MEVTEPRQCSWRSITHRRPLQQAGRSGAWCASTVSVREKRKNIKTANFHWRNTLISNKTRKREREWEWIIYFAKILNMMIIPNFPIYPISWHIQSQIKSWKKVKNYIVCNFSIHEDQLKQTKCCRKNSAKMFKKSTVNKILYTNLLTHNTYFYFPIAMN